jgi:hypothetical protein
MATERQAWIVRQGCARRKSGASLRLPPQRRGRRAAGAAIGFELDGPGGMRHLMASDRNGMML